MGHERYRIQSLLGRGSQGESFLAWDCVGERQVVLKYFSLREARSWKSIELAEREVRILSQLDHAGCPRYVEHYDSAETLVLAMSYVDGESLAAHRARTGVVSLDVVKAFLVAVADILFYLRTREPAIVHRDIKPSNVIRRSDGSFALIDFGAVTQRLVPEGTTVAGTFGYMAPEQLLGQASPASDVYSVGATALALLTGKEPEALPRKGFQIDVAAALPGLRDSQLRCALQQMLLVDSRARGDDLGAILAHPPRARILSHPALAVAVTALAATTVGVASLACFDHPKSSPARVLPLPEPPKSRELQPAPAPVPGSPIEIVPPWHRVHRVAVDASGVYFRAGTILGAIHPPSLEIKELAREIDVGEIAVDAASVYWVGDKGVGAIPKTGGTAREIASADMSIVGKRPHAAFPTLALGDDESVYFTNDRLLQRAPKSGAGPIETLYRGANGLRIVSVSENHVFFLEVCELGLTEGDPYAEILRVVSTNGHDARIVAPKLSNVWSMAVDDRSIYWLDATFKEKGGRWWGDLRRMPREGGRVAVLANVGPTFYPDAIALDDHRVYWLERETGRLMSFEKADPWNPTELSLPGQRQPIELANVLEAQGIAVDPLHVYLWGKGVTAIVISP